MGEPDGGGGGAGLAAFHAIDADGRLGLVVEHHGRPKRDRIAKCRVAVAQGAGGIGDVAALVRVDGDGVGPAQRLVLALDVVAHRIGRDARGGGHGTVLAVAEHGAEVAAPGGIGMDHEVEAAGAVAVSQLEQALEGIDGALLRAADDRDGAQHGHAAADRLLERLRDGVERQAGVEVDALHPDGILAEAEQGGGLGPGVVTGGRGEEDGRLRNVAHEVAVEGDQADVAAAVAGERLGEPFRLDAAGGHRGGQPGNHVHVEVQQRPGVQLDEAGRLPAPERDLDAAGRGQGGHFADRLAERRRRTA